MTSDDSHNASADSLERLLRLAPDRDRAERVRVRCRTQLEHRQRQTTRRALTGFAWRVLAPSVVGGVCVVYIVALVATTLRLQDVFQ